MFTTNGKIIAIAAAVLLVIGALLNYPELVALGLGCLLILALATAWIIVRLDMIAVREIDPPRVVEGDPAQAVLTVTNRSLRRSPPVTASEQIGGRVLLIGLPSLASKRSHTAEYQLPTDRRGVFPVGPLTIGQSDPLRLFRVGRSFASQSVLRVHPRVHDVDPVPTGNSQDMEGPTSSSSPQGGIAFHAIREWSFGDDFRLIHWLSTARTGQLQVRQMVTPDQPRIIIVLDVSSEPYTDASFEDAVRVAASLAVAALRRGFPVGLWTTGGTEIPPATHREDGRAHILDTLAAVGRSVDDRGLSELISLEPDDIGTSVAVVTGQLAPAKLAVVGAVRHRFQMVSVVQVGELHGRAAALPSGVVGINVHTSQDFVPAWNRLVRR